MSFKRTYNVYDYEGSYMPKEELRIYNYEIQTKRICKDKN